MRHISERHKITDDEHQSWGLSCKPFIKNPSKRNRNAFSNFFCEIIDFYILFDDKTQI